ncbi:MAG TPA: DMT family transporter [Candidatus Sulfotelmatobacter sp.]|nr:DMT family transporter [Candidatus Sulfotelmatobacter sp.]
MSVAPSSPADLRTRAVRNLVLCTVFWALSFPVMRALAFTQARLLPEGGSWFFTSLGVMYRFGFAGLILVPFFWRSLKTLTRRELEQGMVLSAFGVGGILLQMDGLAYTDASISAFLTQGYCVFIPLWVAMGSRKLPAAKIIFCIALVVIGTAILAKLDFHSFKLGRGEMETILASFFFTGQILALESPRYAANRAGNFSIIMFLCMALFALPLVIVTAPAANACLRAYASMPACGLMAVLVVFCTLISYTVMNRWQKYISATEAGLIYTIEPVCASVLSLFLPAIFSAWASVYYPNEHFSLRLLVGGGLITVANVILQFSAR